MRKCSVCGELCAEDINEELPRSDAGAIIVRTKENGEAICLNCDCKILGEIVEISPMVSPDLLKRGE